MALLAGQMQVSAAKRERGIIELVCVRCRRVIGLERAEEPGRPEPVRTTSPQAPGCVDNRAGAIPFAGCDPATSCTRCGTRFPIHQAGLLRGEILCPECAPPLLLPVRRRVEPASHAGPVRTLGLCRACAGELTRTGGGQAGAGLRGRGRE